MTDDTEYMQRAIELALTSEREGNLPVGAVIVLDDEIVGEGYSAVVEPEYDPGRHAEIEAIDAVPTELWPRAGQMTCYTTLEPCMMCAGTLLLHGVGRVVFGAHDRKGGAGQMLDHLPDYYDEGGVYDWEGPLMPGSCDPLYERADAAFAELPVGRHQFAGRASDEADAPSPDDHLEQLEQWAGENPDSLRLTGARQAAEAFVERAPVDRLGQVIPHLREIFRAGGYLKDLRTLEAVAERAGYPEAFDDVAETVRHQLPDVWIRRALKRGEEEAAVDCWFEHEDHSRARLVADELVDACGEGRVDVLVSGRLSRIEYRIGRSSRRHYRKACDLLRQLRDELEEAGESRYWHFVLEDLTEQYDNRPALLDEMEQAGFL